MNAWDEWGLSPEESTPPPAKNKPPKPAKNKSPNSNIDDAIETMMKKIKAKGDDAMPPDVIVKIINTAIAWEKAKHQIVDAENPFNPDDL